MTELLTAAQMRAIEQAAIASGEVTGLELMERAGRGVVEAIFEEWPELKATSHRAVVLCGPGNNGGDGFVVARLLKEWGWEIRVLLHGDADRLPPDARTNYLHWCALGDVHVHSLDAEDDPAIWVETAMYDGPEEGEGINPEHVVIVDALFGTGLTRPMEEAGLIAQEAKFDDDAFDVHFRRVAVDVPSGLCSDSGRVLEAEPGWPKPLAADLTVSFHGLKAGHVLADGPRLCGKLKVVDIGLKQGWPQLGLIDRVWPGILSKDRRWARSDHKYSHGHALILSGPSGRGGAARLAARGALRIGAGVVTVGCPTEAIPENAARLDAVMLRPVADAAVLAAVLEDGRINALCLGPGLGMGEREAGLVGAVLGRVGNLPTRRARGGQIAHPTPTVLDADALTILAREPDLFAALHGACVLTPHAGEFARLFPDIAARLAAPAIKGPAYSKVDATREAAARAGCVVLYKGPDTVIADPSGRCSINSAHYDRAAPWLATAGAGDVLAGFITGLLARGFDPMQAAETAAWLHVECARHFGPGLIAEDLPEQLPAVYRGLGL
ncbi:NAD(P)H-hydrate dehydratase [Albidovulum sp.]|uniref:NAD(P)H-hydrate dehydratase n=1 Tax=Albidovulum sp. TaxID=1872424 RepID=UPI0039B8B204